MLGVSALVWLQNTTEQKNQQLTDLKPQKRLRCPREAEDQFCHFPGLARNTANNPLGQAQPQNYESGLYHIDTTPFTELNTAHVSTENVHYIPITQKSLFCKRASILMQLTTAALLKDPSGLRRLHHLLSDWKHFKHSAGTEVTCQSQTDQERSGFYYCIFNPSFLLSSSLYS